MIEGYIGLPGSGKTYTMTARVLDALERRPKLTVFANYAIDHRRVERIREEDLLNLAPGLVVIDEAHLWFESRLSLRLPPSLIMKLSQTRKAGWDMLWSTQHESRVDKILRNNANCLWLCNAWLGGAVFVSKAYEPHEFRKPKKHIQRKLRYFDSRVALAYDTLETLEVAKHIGTVKDLYRDGVPAEAAKRPAGGVR